YISCVSLTVVSHHPPPPSFAPLSLHDALPILPRDVVEEQLEIASREALAQPDLEMVVGLVGVERAPLAADDRLDVRRPEQRHGADRKSTRLNSSHQIISYAVFCLKKKKSLHLV